MATPCVSQDVKPPCLNSPWPCARVFFVPFLDVEKIQSAKAIA